VERRETEDLIRERKALSAVKGKKKREGKGYNRPILFPRGKGKAGADAKGGGRRTFLKGKKETLYINDSAVHIESGEGGHARDNGGKKKKVPSSLPGRKGRVKKRKIKPPLTLSSKNCCGLFTGERGVRLNPLRLLPT